mmetsp:Transcript_44766/g.108144  ORF Transcript_44766/g.108144 Transcript_44766/m.108144 type:complete len:385 (-) Transcript_44766:3296-4450(-)|eukprot:CAMPEP_0113647524 /NCGR_PEP_ID=MMETSP0017_2-20120614/25164_1 /TAXON_ID=2856 /ORGANISM="Cylindrotheca closterium" /LENGTH=384 /DNA_ID=CAMNT_0000559601 /DNA_START=104 /DNA_END=1258 /DNA_ORIENTATION=- /assembly_acc=CAM_ASM_000147
MLLTANARRSLLTVSRRLPIKAATKLGVAQQRGNASKAVIDILEHHRRHQQTWRKLVTFGLGMGALQYTFGESDNFFEHKFVTRKKPEDLADFYGTEDFMELFCVFPFMAHLMMRNAEFDDDGTIHAFGLMGPGELEISIDFDETEIDTNGDGEPDTLSWFNKKESFQDFAPSFLGGFKLWEMTQNFGYHWRADGTCEVYHQGEHFKGFFPVRLLFAIHSRYVIWATEKYINSDAFGAEDREDDLEVQRQNIPLHVFKQFVEGLTVELEKAKDAPNNTAQQKKDIEVTLRRLKTISDVSAATQKGAELDQPVKLPRMRTLRSRKSKVTKTIFVIDDKETKDTIQTAMEQIGSSSGKKHEPAAEMKKLARHATIVARRTQNKPSA